MRSTVFIHIDDKTETCVVSVRVCVCEREAMFAGCRARVVLWIHADPPFDLTLVYRG